MELERDGIYSDSLVEYQLERNAAQRKDLEQRIRLFEIEDDESVAYGHSLIAEAEELGVDYDRIIEIFEEEKIKI